MTFRGTKTTTIRSDAGQVFTLDYDVEVDGGGLRMELEGPDDEVVWDASFWEDAVDTVQLTLEQSGAYTLVVEGQETEGGFDLAWELE